MTFFCVVRASAAALALILASSCASSPIKQLECTNEEGELIDRIFFDPKDKVAYQYDHFTESLKPVDPAVDGLYDEREIVFTDSGKIKERRLINGSDPEYGLISFESLSEINLRELTFQMEEIKSNSKLKDIEAAESIAEKKAIIDRNLEVANSGSVIDTTTTTTKGTCKYVTPKTTNVLKVDD